jgi:hypothetical protein
MSLHAPELDWVAVRPEVTLVVTSIIVLLVALVRTRAAQVAAGVLACSIGKSCTDLSDGNGFRGQ